MHQQFLKVNKSSLKKTEHVECLEPQGAAEQNLRAESSSLSALAVSCFFLQVRAAAHHAVLRPRGDDDHRLRSDLQRALQRHSVRAGPEQGLRR